MPKMIPNRTNELNSAKPYCFMSADLVLFSTTDIAYDNHKVSLYYVFKEGEFSPAFYKGSGFHRVFLSWNLTRVNLLREG